MAEEAPAADCVLRVVSYNVRDLLDDHDAVAHVLRSCRADVVVLQEAPRRPGTRHRLRRLARETALRWVSGGRGSGGTAVLVHPRLDVLRAESHRLRVSGPFTRRRGFAVATVAGPGLPPLTVASVHLPLRQSERLAHCRVVLAHLAELEGPFVVGGDLNEPPGGPSWAALGEVLRDAAEVLAPADAPPTYPARAPRHRIDALLLSADLRVLSLGVAGQGEGLDAAVLAEASDHLPLLAVITHGGGGGVTREAADASRG